MRRTNIAQDLPLDPNRPAPEIGATIGFEEDYNFATKRNSLNQVDGQYRTSLVIEPANGQIPLTLELFGDLLAFLFIGLSIYWPFYLLAFAQMFQF
jgi:hypothetical protein